MYNTIVNNFEKLYKSCC